MSIGVNLLVSKFRIVPSQCWRCAPFVRATRPKRNQVPVAAQKGPYSISSSTRATNDGDSVAPSARAVAGLIDKRNK
jgi:hypothetical protein